MSNKSKVYKHPKNATRTRGLRRDRRKSIPRCGQDSTVMSPAVADAIALPRLYYLLSCWLPCGKVQGDQYIALNPTRDDRNLGSFQINIKNGLWADFATDDKGKGAVSLASYLFDIPQKDAIEFILNSKEIRK